MRASLPVLLAVAALSAAAYADHYCNGVVNPRERKGICGRPLYYLTASYCCWFCNTVRVIKHNPERLFDLNRGDSTHFNFTQCRVDAWQMVQKRRPPRGDVADSRVEAQMNKLGRLNRNTIWQITPSGRDLHCDCCVNSCTVTQLGRYCSCVID